MQRFTQWIIFQLKIYTWLGTFRRYNCIRRQLNNEAGEELNEKKKSRDKMEIGKE